MHDNAPLVPLQILLDHVSKHLEDACKTILLDDEPLTKRVEMASVELELLKPNDIAALPEELQTDIEALIKLGTDEVKQDAATVYASRLLEVFVKAELLRSQGVKR
jgi:hypothetical protein